MCTTLNKVIDVLPAEPAHCVLRVSPPHLVRLPLSTWTSDLTVRCGARLLRVAQTPISSAQPCPSRLGVVQGVSSTLGVSPGLRLSDALPSSSAYPPSGLRMKKKEGKPTPRHR